MCSSTLNELSAQKATGIDDISAKYLKYGEKSIGKQLKIIIDKSFDEHKFPDIWKTAKVFPVFKSGNKEEMDNYRPISILCAVSKIIEKHVHKHFYNFLTQYDLISPTQNQAFERNTPVKLHLHF